MIGAGAHHELFRVDRAPVRKPPQVLCDRLAELRQACVGRVAGVASLDGLNSRLRHRRRGVEVGLADAQVEDVLSRRLAPLGLGADGNGLRTLQVLQVGGEWIGHAKHSVQWSPEWRWGWAKASCSAERCQWKAGGRRQTLLPSLRLTI